MHGMRDCVTDASSPMALLHPKGYSKHKVRSNYHFIAEQKWRQEMRMRSSYAPTKENASFC
jgi:hypothetical protein